MERRDHAADQVISASPVDMRDGYRRIVLETRGGAQLLSRVRPDEIADSAKYEYWDGSAWRRDLATAAPLWSPPSQGEALARLGTFQGSASIAYNEDLRAYVALVNIGIDKIGARVSSRLEGPWSDPEPWLDCSTVAKPALPVCYSPAQHPEFAAEGGRELFVTFTRMATYDVVAYRIGLEPAGRR